MEIKWKVVTCRLPLSDPSSVFSLVQEVQCIVSRKLSPLKLSIQLHLGKVNTILSTLSYHQRGNFSFSLDVDYVGVRSLIPGHCSS